MEIDGNAKLRRDVLLLVVLFGAYVIDVERGGLVLGQTMKSSSFKTAMSSTGAGVCATDQPKYTVGVKTTVDCSVSCAEENIKSSSTGCGYFNFRSSSSVTAGNCDLYSVQPNCYAVLPNCKHYQNSTTKTVVSIMPAADATICSFPYTYNGQLYYQCTANQSNSASPCDVGCFLRNRTWITCTLDTQTYIAQNVSKNVSVSTTASSPILFRSVNNWIVIHSRVDSNYPVNQLWTKYVQGFGDSSSGGNFWLGLENMHQLTKSSPGASYRLRFEIQASANGKWFSTEYDSFYIDSSTTGYVLRVSTGGSGVVGDAGDPLNDKTVSNAMANGMPFSARNNDRSNGCPTIYQGGWWFNYCGRCNLNAAATTSYYYWHQLVFLGLSPTYNLQTSRMMVMVI